MNGFPIILKVLGQMIAGLLELVFVEHNVKHVVGQLEQLVGRVHLDAQLARLRLAARLYQALQNLRRRHLQVDQNWRQGSLGHLCRVVNCITIKRNQLHGARQLKNALNFGRHLAQLI